MVPNRVTSTRKTLYLTFDVDWLCDEGIEFTLDRLETLGVTATFFVTHDTPVLHRVRDSGHELGIHPNFNPLLGTRQNALNDSAADAVAALARLVPEATTVRSHSLTKSACLSSLFREFGYTHEANLFIPAQSRIRLRPFRGPDGLVQLAHNWGDYAHWSAPRRITPDEYLGIAGLKILNFHPIHIFLNTNDLGLYHRAKPHTRDYSRLRAFVNGDQEGTRCFLDALVTLAKARGFRFEQLRTVSA